VQGSSITQVLGGEAGRNTPCDATDASSELPFTPQQSLKNAPVLGPSFKPLQSRFVQCSLRGRLDWFYKCRSVVASRRLGEKPVAAQTPRSLPCN